eukprot:7133771-Prymnesium_polylepis.1
MLRGALLLLPMPKAPGHIPVLQRLKRWQQTELIPSELYEQLQRDLIAQSRCPTGDGSSSSIAPTSSATTAAAPASQTSKQPAAAAEAP